MLTFGRLSENLGGLDAVLIVLALAWTIASAWFTLRKKDLALTVLSALGATILFVASSFWWTEVQEGRQVLTLLPLVVVVLVLAKRLWRSAPARHIGTAYCLLATANYGSIALLTRFSPFGMWNSDTLSSVSPDARYAAVVVNHDGLTYGFDYIALRPNRLELRTLFDRPERYVAEMVLEGDVSALRWNSPTDLSVLMRPKAEIVWKRDRWNEVKIHYQIDPHADSQ